MASYHLAPSLSRLRTDVNTLWHGRDKTSDGWIGDASHAARPSDHNPDWRAGGVVRALDIDKDGLDKHALVAAAIQDPRTEYVIFEGLIYQRKYGFKPLKYTGANSHHGHVHISIRHGAKYEQDTRAWAIASMAVAGASSDPGPSSSAPISRLTFPDITEDNMLVIARTQKDPKVWIGDGVTRRHIATQDTLKSVQWLASKGILTVYANGAVQTIDDLWALGHPIDNGGAK